VFHGSRDPRSQRAATQLTNYFREKISQLTPGAATIAAAYLECHPLTLSEQIQQLIKPFHGSWDTSKTIQWRIIPVFLLAGLHVMDDLPAAIATVQATLNPSPMLQLTPYLGVHPGITRLLLRQMAAVPMDAWILIAHGSRRPTATAIVEQLAAQVDAKLAYWSTPPSLETRVQELVNLGLQRIGIFPYFLFSGGTMEAIGQQVTQLADSFPDRTLQLAAPLEANLPELADLLIDLAMKPAIVGVGN